MPEEIPASSNDVGPSFSRKDIEMAILFLVFFVTILAIIVIGNIYGDRKHGKSWNPDTEDWIEPRDRNTSLSLSDTFHIRNINHED